MRRLAERYERRSVIITSNLVFSHWDKIFKDPMTTAAAIDRLVHHATILELTGKSYRSDAAKRRQASLTHRGRKQNSRRRAGSTAIREAVSPASHHRGFSACQN